ncbi:MAG: hypothetical protein Q7R93_03745 [bacterium]|nr:hypothetical protein [bacterium]
MQTEQSTTDRVENISESSMRDFKRQLRSLEWKKIPKGIKLALLPLMLIGLLFGPFFFIFFLAGGLLAWYALIRHKMQAQFWNEFAAARGWSYTPNKSIDGEKALLFREGENREALHAVTGTYHEQPFSIFEYTYTQGSGKSKTTYHYTIFEVRFSGVFPHFYLNNIASGDYIPFSEKLFLPKLSLPAEFEKQFVLYAPKQYEIEALEVFSPDILDFFLTEKWTYDFELTDSELIISRPGHINSTAELESELQTVQRLTDRLAPKLNRMRFAQIGDYKPTL